MGFASLGARILSLGKKIGQPSSISSSPSPPPPARGQRLTKNLVGGLPSLLDQNEQPSIDPNYQDQNYAMHEQRRARLSRLGM